MESKAKRTHKFSKEGRGRYFLIAALFASLASMLILADSFRVYESKVTAILIAKSDRAATLSRSMVENTVLLADTMAYQNRFFEAISSKSGAFDETPDALRRASFRKMISVSAGEEGSVLSIRGIAEDPDDSKERARQASLTLFQFFGQYYNIKDDVEFRIIEGPVTSSVIGNKWGFFGASLALGVLSTGVLFLALFSLPSLMGRMRKEEVFHKPFLDAKVFEPERPLSSPYFDQEKDRAEDVSSIDELFSEEEGVALRLLEDAVQHLLARLDVRARLDVGRHFIARQPAQDDAVEPRLAVQRRERLRQRALSRDVRIAIVPDDQHAHP